MQLRIFSLAPAIVICYLAACAAQDSPVPNKGASCKLKNGTTVSDGARFHRDPCTTCHCDNGSVLCFSKSCGWPVCASGFAHKVMPGHCCPSCQPISPPPTMTSTSSPSSPSSTPGQPCKLSNGTLLPDGGSFRKNRCTDCTCRNGQLFCPQPPCPPPLPGGCKAGYHMGQTPDMCCPGCIPDSNATTVVAPTVTPSPKCLLDNGSYVPDGSSFQNSPCSPCMCRRGMVRCMIIDCPPPSLLVCPTGQNPATLPGKCCRSCEADCVQGSKTYRSGSTFMASDGCNTCSCTDGKVFCTMKACINPCDTVKCPGGKVCKLQKVQCIRAPCPPQAVCVDAATPSSSNGTMAPMKTPTPGICGAGMCKDNVPCSFTGGKAMCGCSYGNVMYKNGDIYPDLDGCNTCFCTNGSSSCTEKYCPDKCQTVRCQNGYTCKLQIVECKKAPCPKEAKCVPIPTVVPPSCPVFGCPQLFYCRYGFARGDDGCFICQCNNVSGITPLPKQCPAYRCMSCPTGNIVDPKTGCAGCRCVPAGAGQCHYKDVFNCFASRNVTGLRVGPGKMPSAIPCQTLQDAIACHKTMKKSGAMRGCSDSQNQTLSTVVASVTRLASYNCPNVKCFAGGKAFHVNQSFYDSTGCKCYCSASGTTCTRCSPTGCRYGVNLYGGGKKFPALDGCNDCSCEDGEVSCSTSKCNSTRYVNATVKFPVSYKGFLPDSSAVSAFKRQFVQDIAKLLFLSEAQITVLSVKPGSIVVTFAVQSQSLDDVQEQLDEVIGAHNFVITFENQQLVADNIDFAMAAAVGSLPGDTPDGDDGGSMLGVIIGVSCGVGAVVIVAIVVVVVVMKRKKSATYRHMSKASFAS